MVYWGRRRMERVSFPIFAFVEHRKIVLGSRHLLLRGLASRSLIPAGHKCCYRILHMLHLVFHKGLRCGVFLYLSCTPFC